MLNRCQSLFTKSECAQLEHKFSSRQDAVKRSPKAQQGCCANKANALVKGKISPMDFRPSRNFNAVWGGNLQKAAYLDLCKHALLTNGSKEIILIGIYTYFTLKCGKSQHKWKNKKLQYRRADNTPPTAGPYGSEKGFAAPYTAYCKKIAEIIYVLGIDKREGMWYTIIVPKTAEWSRGSSSGS